MILNEVPWGCTDGQAYKLNKHNEDPQENKIPAAFVENTKQKANKYKNIQIICVMLTSQHQENNKNLNCPLFVAAIRHRDFPSGAHIENVAVLQKKKKKKSPLAHNPRQITTDAHFLCHVAISKRPRKRLHGINTMVLVFRHACFIATSHPNTSDHLRDYKILQQGWANLRGCLGRWKSSMSPPSRWSPNLHTLNGFWREIIVPLDHNVIYSAEH